MPAIDLACRLQLQPGSWDTLLDGLCARFPQIDRATWSDRFARGRVLDIAGNAMSAGTPYRVGMEVRYFREVVEEEAIPFVETVLHADADLVVADKPHFLPVVPSGRYLRESLLRRLVERLDNPELVPLHRIDRATAGLVLFSANPATRGAYQALFRERRIHKRYEAIAPALPKVAFPLLRQSRIERGEPFFRMHETEGAANASTRISVLGSTGDAWRYALEPVTGRKHQLRVHMAALGAPIRNDRWYPDLSDVSDDDFTRPLQLVARSLAFVDPRDGNQRRFVSTLALQT